MTERMMRCWLLVIRQARCYLEDMTAPPRDRHIPDLVSATEAAAMLGVTRQAVQLMANNGQLLGAKVGNTWVFRRVLVEREATERRAQTDEQAGEPDQAAD